MVIVFGAVIFQKYLNIFEKLIFLKFILILLLVYLFNIDKNDICIT
jgi:hypothetical protein